MTRVLGWLAVAFGLWYLLTNPDGAASVALGILHGLQSAAEALSKFANHF